MGSESLNEAIPYMVIPGNRSTLGRAVVGFVHLDNRGFLDEDAPKLYGVISKPLSDASRLADNEGAMKWSQEANVVAEDLAYRRGIFTPNGRTSAELTVLQEVQGPAHRPEYLDDRIAHLNGCRSYAISASSEPQWARDRAATELTLAIEALSEYL